MTEIVIDPNVRADNGVTYSGFEDVRGELPKAGEFVLAREIESNVITEAIVTRVDEDSKLIYLAVAWSRLRDDKPMTQDEFHATYRQAARTW
ncbi:hypothetical protein [Nocardia sp. NPDC019255]|uniref:hypothetical protein n=1 Tax=Nocardia sp. NPDC019255 TaxID=3154591 RepID=UPI0033DD47F2